LRKSGKRGPAWPERLAKKGAPEDRTRGDETDRSMVY